MKKLKIGIFGHYGNCNLGDEAIIEAIIQNLRQRIDNCEIVCLSINPFDSRDRHKVDSFPIRFRKDFFKFGKDYQPPTRSNRPVESATSHNAPTSQSKGIKKKIKQFPLVGTVITALAKFFDKLVALKNEIYFLNKARNYTRDLDLLLITGSNQLLDNYGGSWGFPYTLLKWTLLAKSTGTKVGYISVGAGPLTLPLSFKMLDMALKKADYISYRDEGSKELVESRIKINHPVYPDIAHSLQMKVEPARDTNEDNSLTIAVNPMPVYDHRYWYLADEKKYRDYCSKVAEVAEEILNKGHTLCLFSTQPADSNVIEDIETILKSQPDYESVKHRIQVNNSSQVDQLVRLLGKSDIVIATRFHATLLPLQLQKPVIGICYYRKAAELLDEMGLQEFHVDVDNFEVDNLKNMLNKMLAERHQLSDSIATKYNIYKTALNEQYDAIVKLAS